jgi:DNA-binding transcriptional LysR family regulator
MVNIVEEGVDLAVRIGNLPNSGFSALKVGSVRRVLCGAPAYFEKHGAPAAPADLAGHAVISPTSAWASTEWRFGQDQKTVVHVYPRLYCNTNDAALRAAVEGFGLTRILSYQAAPALASGALQTVLSAYEEAPLPIHLVHPEGRHAPAKVRTFIDFAAERLRADRRIN